MELIKESEQTQNRFYSTIFSPGAIGSMSTRNRIVLPAIGTNLGTIGGHVTQRLIDFHRARARGGVGMNIIEITCVDSSEGKADPRQLCVDTDEYIPGLAKLAAAIQDEGSKAILQLHHAGGVAKSTITGMQPVSASPIKVDPFSEKSRSLTILEIDNIVRKFSEAAVRAKVAGFDAVEIHAAHVYLLQQFLSGTLNQRVDAYGGALQNRARFLLETIQAVKMAVGREYVVWCRMNATDFDNGFTVEDAKQVALWAEKAGLDAIHVSASPPIRSVYAPIGWNLLNTGEIKKVLKIPVIAAGCLEISIGEEAIRNRLADFIAIGRPLVADPEVPVKTRENRREDIVPCIRCLRCLTDYILAGKELECSVNVMVGRERENGMMQTDTPKKVLIIGGGPAGLEAALISAKRGHAVILCERTSYLGGQLRIAAKPPHKELIASLREHLIREAHKQNVFIKTNVEATRSLVSEMNPDVVILATGAHPLIPNIPGVGSENVIMYDDVLSGKVMIEQRLIIIGGGLVGCETANYLTDMNKEVTIVETLPRLMSNASVMIRIPLLNLLKAKGVSIITNAQVKEIFKNGVMVSIDGSDSLLEADQVILATGAEPDNAMAAELRNAAAELYVIGDAVETQFIKEAVSDGFRVGLQI